MIMRHVFLHVKVRCILVFLLFAAGSLNAANDLPPTLIQGSSTGATGGTAVYYVDDGTSYGTYGCPMLFVSGQGTVIASSEVGTRYEITVAWVNSGTATITFFNECNGTNISSKTVTVSCTTTVPNPVINLPGGPSCGPKTLTYTETPPYGVTWYWQTTTTGTSTTNSTQSYVASGTGYYYVRAKANCGAYWSTGYDGTDNLVTINSIPSSPSIPTVSSNTCGDKILSKNGSPGAGLAWYWQGTNASGTDNSSPQATGGTYAASIYGTNSYWLRTQNTSTGCWSASSTGTGATVNTPPAPAPASFSSCEFDTPFMTTGGIVGTLRWYNDQNALVNTGASYSAPSMNNGTYTYTVKNYISTCEGPGATVTLQVGSASCDNYRNWTQQKLYGINGDGSPKEISSSRSYTDGFGNVIQAQSKSYSKNQILATQNIYDSYGRQSLTTLPAPINSSSFGYKHRFVMSSTNSLYSKSDFDLTTTSGAAGEVNNPRAVVANGPGSLGWYYSTSNTLEPATPASNYPYSRRWTEKTAMPKKSKQGGAGDAYRMGSGHESQLEEMNFTKSELSHYFSLQNYFVTLTATPETNLITNSRANTLFGFSPNNAGLSIVNQSGSTYLKVLGTVSSLSTGVYPIEGNQTVVPGTTYKFRVKGYRSSANTVSLLVKNVTANTNISWATVNLPQGSANEAWVEVSFTVPAGCTSLAVGVQWNSTVINDSFYINDVMLYQTFADNELVYGTKTLMTDADGKKVMTFVDNNEKTLATALVVSQTGYPNPTFVYDNWSYNYYNDIGQLVANVTPNGVNTASTAYPSFVTTYKYDHLGRLYETTGTDDGTTKYVYSLDGKIRFSQSQEQRNASPQRFSYSNYDQVDRIVESGEYLMSGSGYFVFETHNITTPSANSVLNIADNKGYTGVTRRGNNATAGRYSDTTFIDYDYQTLDYIADAHHLVQENRFGLVSRTKNANATTWYSYDGLGRLLWTKQSITGLGTKTVDYTYDYVGNVTDVVYQKGQADDFYHHYIYNEDDNLIEVLTSLDGTNKTSRAKYYYYLHGPLKRVELATNVQGIDYVYTINGTLKTINNADAAKDPGLDGTNGFAPDVFGQTMHYYTNDYNATYNAGTQTLTGYSDQYGGAVKAISWHSPVDNNSQPRTYAYTYDSRQQLAEAKFGNFQSGAFTPDALDAYKENIPGYDKNGNIQSLIRKGKGGTTLGNYGYVYETSTNKLDKVNHNGLMMVDYSYNSVGQMIQQTEGANTMNVAYNVRGITSEIRNSSNQLIVSYTYDDRGGLVKRTDYNAGIAAKTTFYVNDAAGTTLAIYEQSLPAGPITLIELPIYAKGRVALFKPQVNTYFYEINDHQGNVRGVIGTTDTDVYMATMESENGGSEEPPFKNVSARRVVSVAANHTASGNEAVRLNNASPAGPTISLKVSPGDLINLETWAYYESGSSYTNPIASGTMINAIATAFGGVSGAPGEAGQIFTSVNNSLGSGALGLGSTGDPNLPGAYICYMVFDVNRNFTGQGGYYRVTSAGNMTKELITVPQVTIEQPGYLYVCVYNRSDSPNWVYFDDLKVTHAHSPIVAGADYYPFGLPIADRQITQEDYRWGYQGQYAEKDTVTGWNRFQLRMYDARIGRWTTIDPFNQYFSPYNGMGNAPHSLTDPTGGITGLPEVVIKGTRLGQIALKQTTSALLKRTISNFIGVKPCPKCPDPFSQTEHFEIGDTYIPGPGEPKYRLVSKNPSLGKANWAEEFPDVNVVGKKPTGLIKPIASAIINTTTTIWTSTRNGFHYYRTSGPEKYNMWASYSLDDDWNLVRNVDSNGNPATTYEAARKSQLLTDVVQVEALIVSPQIPIPLSTSPSLNIGLNIVTKGEAKNQLIDFLQTNVVKVH